MRGVYGDFKNLIMAKFEKGNKYGSKRKGSVNKRIREWNQFGQVILSEGLDRALIELKKLKGEKYLQAYERFLHYFKPRMTSSQMEVQLNTEGFIIELQSMSKKDKALKIYELQNGIASKKGSGVGNTSDEQMD